MPYGILAIVMLSVFNILPTLLLLLYPCGCFQKCLTCCGIRSVTLHTFMDALQGCYRYKPRDCRYFAGIYLCMRILFLATFVIINDRMILSIAGVYFILLAIVVTIFKPYREEVYATELIWPFFLYPVLCTYYKGVGKMQVIQRLISLPKSLLLYSC